MEISTRVIAFISVLSGVSADSFNYRYSSGNEYGPADWRKVECNDLDSCVSSSWLAMAMAMAEHQMESSTKPLD